MVSRLGSSLYRAVLLSQYAVYYGDPGLINTRAERTAKVTADRLVFDRAIRTVGGRRLAHRDSAALARVTFDGMTAEQVVAALIAKAG